MFHLGHLISLTHSRFIAILSLYIVLIDAGLLIYSVAQLQERLINLLTYLFTYLLLMLGITFAE